MIRFGIIGTNWITDSFLKAAGDLEDFKLAAVYSRTEEKGREFADKYGVQTVFTDVEEMAKSEAVDAVYIASPNSFHSKQAIMLMNHGKHVLCEKPLASNAGEVKDMIAAAKENKVVMMEALKSTMLPGFKAIQESLPRIETIRRYVGNYCQYSSRYDAYKEGNILNAFKPEFSNGALMDLGTYCIYPLVVLFGKPLTVKASGIMLESGVDGEGSVLLTYESMEAVITYSKITDSFLPSEIQGEKGSIVIDRIHTPEKVEIRLRGGSTEEVSRTADHEPMYYEAKEFISLIQQGKLESDINSHSNSLTVMEIMDEIRSQIGVVYPNDSK
ncbi:Gfo/Idh/MocA family protein [Fictibacillus terranigra]|uniref:Gfo/Idh/MocA family oxidoreductase n=1 Tax=Fictibacillus terranigra TaxID=3058424 RepID=A0ABT8E2G7_9BACL|nr:Gfo/Idh/MocA family oxidoreductase [Fictibacillus sp. CENA-BCM004]MDN4072097.1 Gfo/Idh/MocA family oxidoreductase [Fictibacillus sp. CENA-BCM004]